MKPFLIKNIIKNLTRLKLLEYKKVPNKTIYSIILNLSTAFKFSSEKLKKIKFNQILLNDHRTIDMHAQNDFVIYRNKQETVILAYRGQNKNLIIFDVLKKEKIADLKDFSNNNDIREFYHFNHTKNEVDFLLVSDSFGNLYIFKCDNGFEVIETFNFRSKNGNRGRTTVQLIDDKFILFVLSDDKLDFYDFDNFTHINSFYIRQDSISTVFSVERFSKVDKYFIIYENGSELISADIHNIEHTISYNNSEDKAINFVLCYSAKIINSDLTSYLIALYDDYFNTDESTIYIWNLLTGNLLKRVIITKSLGGLCIWNERYLLTCDRYGHFYKIDYQTGTIIERVKSNKAAVCAINKFIHPTYGNSLLILSAINTIELWS
jgi:hypothetical protein